MAIEKLVILLTLLYGIAAQDLEPSPADIYIDNNIIDPLETDALGTTDYVDPLETLDPVGQGSENLPKDFLISWQARRSLRRILAQMPCGWPEHGIPPLAPYQNDNLALKLNNSFFKTETSLKPLRIDGLNNMEIHRLKVGVIFKRVNFDFNFPNITLSGNFDTTTALNLKEIMALGLSLKGSGEFKLTLENLRIKGSLKYKLPIFFGSAKITKINTQVSLGNATSELSGFLNGVPIAGKVNDFIVATMLRYLNEHDFLWNGLIEKHLLPVINTQLEGQTLWKIFLWSITRSENTCTPGELTDMDIMELHQLLLKKPLMKRGVENESANLVS